MNKKAIQCCVLIVFCVVYCSHRPKTSVPFGASIAAISGYDAPLAAQTSSSAESLVTGEGKEPNFSFTQAPTQPQAPPPVKPLPPPREPPPGERTRPSPPIRPPAPQPPIGVFPGDIGSEFHFPKDHAPEAALPPPQTTGIERERRELWNVGTFVSVVVVALIFVVLAGGYAGYRYWKRKRTKPRN